MTVLSRTLYGTGMLIRLCTMRTHNNHQTVMLEIITTPNGEPGYKFSSTYSNT